MSLTASGSAFGQSVLASCVRLVALSEINGRPWASLAELDLLNGSGQRLARTGWTVVASSEDLAGEDGRGSNAIDGSSATLWHTQWLGASPPHPHTLDVRFGSPQTVSALQYLPRQEGSVNGTIAQYEVYASQDCASFARVAQGTWVNSNSRKTAALVDAGLPIANAGADRTVVAGVTVTLTGAASSDPGGSIAAFEWSQTAGPAVTLVGAESVSASFTAPTVAAATVLAFQLRVTDNAGLSATDSVSVTVNPAPGTVPVLSFQEITGSAGVGGPSTFGGHGAMFGDVNGDGLPDLYVTVNMSGASLPDLFYSNLGAGQFREEGFARGIDNLDTGSHGGVWADLDNDGDLDLFNGSFEQNRLYRNDGSGTFTDVTFAAGLPARLWATRGSLAFDMDADGDLDLFAVNGFLGNDDPVGERNEVYRNDGNWQFTAIDTGTLSTALAGQGATSVDFDNDGDVDVFAANRTGPVAVLRNNGAGSFVQLDAVSLGLQPEGRDGLSFADVNNDGFLDVLLSQALYLHNGVSGYVRQRLFDSASYHYMGGFADLDNDGDLDLFYAQKFAANRLIENQLIGPNRWLKVDLRGAGGQRTPHGARVYLYEAGGLGNPSRRVTWWELRSQDGYLSQQDGVLHLGVGARTHVDVRAVFVGGATVDVPNVPTNAWIEIRRP